MSCDECPRLKVCGTLALGTWARPHGRGGGGVQARFPEERVCARPVLERVSAEGSQALTL